MVATLGLTVGLMSFEQLGISYLVPFIQPSLELSNTQVGLLMSAYWMPLAISSYVSGALADYLGTRKLLLLGILILFSLSSFLSGLASSFATLLIARALMGLWAGSLLTISQSMVALESSVEHRSTNFGIVGGVCPNILGIVIAPVILVQLASLYGWRVGFFVVVLPGLLCAILVARLIHEPALDPAAESNSTAGQTSNDGHVTKVLAFRNVWICALLCCLFVAYLSLGFTFLPLFYVNVLQFSSQQMSFLMGLLGISAVLFAFFLPIVSNHIGRKPVMIAASLLSLLCPLAALYFSGPVAVLALFLFVGWALSGTGSFFMGTIPSETVPARSVSTAIGLIIALGVLIGGLAGPSVAGWSADRWGLQAPLLLQAACAAAAAVVSIALHETAPRRIKNTAARLVSVE